MVNKRFWLGILVMVLVLGMTVVGCDNGNNDEKGNNDGTFTLTENRWTSGSIASGVREIIYSFTVVIGRTYDIWWNDKDEGDGTKTLDIRVSAFYSDGAAIFSNADSGWASSMSFISNTNGTVYLRVAPYSSDDTGTFAIVYSTSSTKPNDGSIPTVPTGISASANSSSSITVTWNIVSGASGYRIYRSSTSSGSFKQVESATSTSYTDTGLSANTTYYYKITAYNSNGESPQSTTVSATASSGGGGTDTSLNGTWVDEYGNEMKLNNGNFEVSEVAKGTYTTSGNNITITITHIHGSIMGGMLESKWYSKSEAKFAIKNIAQGMLSDEEIDEMLNEMFFSQTVTYSISGNKLTMTSDGETTTYTKK